jgi:hypothetical protein
LNRAKRVIPEAANFIEDGLEIGGSVLIEQ